MKTKPTTPARVEISTAYIYLTDGRMIRKETYDQLWHLYASAKAVGYTRLQQGEVRALLAGVLWPV